MSKSPHSEEPKKKSPWRKAIVGLVALGLVVLGGGAVYLAYLNKVVSDNLSQERLLPSADGMVTTEGDPMELEPVDRTRNGRRGPELLADRIGHARSQARARPLRRDLARAHLR